MENIDDDDDDDNDMEGNSQDAYQNTKLEEEEEPQSTSSSESTTTTSSSSDDDGAIFKFDSSQLPLAKLLFNKNNDETTNITQRLRQGGLFGPVESSDNSEDNVIEEPHQEAEEEQQQEDLVLLMENNAAMLEDFTSSFLSSSTTTAGGDNNATIFNFNSSQLESAKVLFNNEVNNITLAAAKFNSDVSNMTLAAANMTSTLQTALLETFDDDAGISCRIVARSDGKIPTRRDLLPATLFQQQPSNSNNAGSDSGLLAKLDAIYHAISHEQTRFLQFMQKEFDAAADTTAAASTANANANANMPTTSGESQQRPSLEADEEIKAMRVLRTSLEDSGFNLMNRRDLDLCQALNAEYLLRLSILEDLSELDGSIANEFYPELLLKTVENETDAERKTASSSSRSRSNDDAGVDTDDMQNLLYEGRVLLFWRGYGQELTRGRLLLPKIDYLQASIVQRTASKIRAQLTVVEEGLAMQTKVIYDRVETWSVSLVANALQMIPSDRVSEWARVQLVEVAEKTKLRMRDEKRKRKDEKKIRFRRYGGSTDALTPFTICEVEYENAELEALANANGTVTSALFESETVNHGIYEAMNRGRLSCQYDGGAMDETGFVPPMQLLERVSISNLVDFAPSGTSNIFKTIFGKNELLEPTYQEVIVVWRPLPPKPRATPVFTPPKFVYDFADMFDIEGLPDLPDPEDEIEVARPPLEIRAFAGVPMANLPAVLPKTKLVFRPADAFVFDLASIVSLVLVIGSQRFDNPRLDLLAVVSFSLWLVRTVIRYSNKLARYDLLVKKFLTSKITARNSGALKYLSTEAGSYRARRAALVYTWLTSSQRKAASAASNDRSQLVKDGLLGVNGLIREDKQVRVDIEAALKDLEACELVIFSDDGKRLEKVVWDESGVESALRNTWLKVFEDDTNLVANPLEDTAPRP